MVTETIKRKDGCKAKGRISGVPSLVLGAVRTVGTLPHAAGVLHPPRIAAPASRGAHLPLGEARAPGRQPCGLGNLHTVAAGPVTQSQGCTRSHATPSRK